MEPTGMISRSSYYRILKAEQDEINRLKWIESEKAGRDIGWHHAWFLWTTKHKSTWFSEIYASGKKNI